MKKIFIAIILIILFSLPSYSQSIYREDSRNSLGLPNGKYGVKNDSGKILIPAEYKHISQKDDYFFFTDCNSLKGVYDMNGRLIIKPGSYKYISQKGGLFFFKNENNQEGAFDKNEKLIIEPDNYEYLGVDVLSKYYITAKKNGKEGLFDISGNIILPVIYDDVFLNRKKEGNEYIVTSIEVEIGPNKGLFDPQGNELIPLSYKYTYIDAYRYPKETLIKVKDGEKSGIYDAQKKQEIISPNKYLSISNIEDNYYYAHSNYRTVILLLNRKEVYSGIGDYIKKSSENDDLFEVYYGNKGGYVNRNPQYYLINSKGKVITPIKYSRKNYYGNNKDNSFQFIYFQDSLYRWGVEDTLGVTILKNKFDEIWFEHQFQGFEVALGCYRGLYDKTGKMLIPANKYTKLDFDSRIGKFIVTDKNNKNGIVDSFGKELIAPQYDDISPVNTACDFYYVKQECNIGVIDSNGKEIIPIEFCEIKYVTDQPSLGPYFRVHKNGKIGLYNIEGVQIIPPKFSEISIHDPKYYGNIVPWIETHNNQFKGAYDINGIEIISADKYTSILYSYILTAIPFFDVTDQLGQKSMLDLSGNIVLPLSNYDGFSIQKNELLKSGYEIHIIQDGILKKVEYTPIDNKASELGIQDYEKAMLYHTSQDYNNSIIYLEKSAEKGYAPAQNMLGVYYHQGLGVSSNTDIAIQWYLKASQQKNIASLYNLGLIYEEGTLVKQDYKEAFKWFKKAADEGDAESRFKVGYYFSEGLGTHVDYGEANKYYRMAELQGNLFARANLANHYLKGLGVKQNYLEAYKLYKRAAERGYSYAQAMLGMCYNEGIGVEQNFSEAFKWFSLAAENNEVSAILNLGTYYEKGICVKQDLVTAFELYQKAANAGNPMGLYNVGICYANGKGVFIDYVKTFTNFERAANMNLDIAQYDLAVCYEKGIGVAKNMEKAIYWYKKAATQGNQSAEDALSRLNK